MIRKPEIWYRLQLCVVTGVILWAVTGGWAPPFKYRVRSVPQRDMHARVRFEYTDNERTKDARERASRAVPCFYENDGSKLDDLRNSLIEKIFAIKDKEFAEISLDDWKSFFEPTALEDLDNEKLKTQFDAFKESIAADTDLAQLKHAVEVAFIPFEKSGLLTTLEHQPDQGSMLEIQVIPVGNLTNAPGKRVETEEVRIAAVAKDIRDSIRKELKNQSNIIKNHDVVADHLFYWMRPQLPVTLKYRDEITRRARRRAAAEVTEIKKVFEPGDPLDKQNISDDGERFIRGGVPLDDQDVKLLHAEHVAFVKQMNWQQIMAHIFADFGMYAALLSFLVAYLYYRESQLISDIRRFSTLLGLFLVAICSAWLLSINLEWRAELVPLTFFAMTVAIAFHREIAVVMSAIASLVFTVAHGFALTEFVILVATTATAGLLCGSIRSRTKLVYVGLIAAAVAFPTVIGVSTLFGQPLSRYLLVDAIWFSASAILAGVTMTALLPFLERWFDIQTDISLLELSDANHPLLRKLAQSAPGTYNHSINIASMAEAAAAAIGANGLLCRVGAYFHDIGKIRKPEYFIENQSGTNKHDDLVPTMSTLVIIAHVKDGSEMARSHRLPGRIVDLIEQHHGTTLVQFFYNQAKKNSVNENDVEESDFRYPGPKPQTLEAAVMMISDAVESASRTLRDPAPARLETLVREIIKKRLDDDQFDECPITIQQLNAIEKSLIKSLNATYHSRVKYPEQDADGNQSESQITKDTSRAPTA